MLGLKFDDNDKAFLSTRNKIKPLFKIRERDFMTRIEFESIIISDICNKYPEYKEKLRQQLSFAVVKERVLSKYGFSTYFTINHSHLVTLGKDVKLSLETDGWRVNGLSRGRGYILRIENGVIHSLEGFSYEEPWQQEIVFCEKI